MAATLTELVVALSKRLGYHQSGTTTVMPDITTDTDAGRVLISDRLYDIEAESDKEAGMFAWTPQYGSGSRTKRDGHTTTEGVLFLPPASSVYTLTVHGYGTTGLLSFASVAATVQSALRLIAGCEEALVSGTGQLLIQIPGVPVGITPSAGTLISNQGLGRLEVVRPFDRVLPAGTAFHLLSTLPWDDSDNLTGLRTHINDALKRMSYITRAPLTPTRGGQRVFPLTGNLSFIKRRQQIVALYGSGIYNWTSSFTPPVAGSYTLTLSLGGVAHTTTPLAFGANDGQIADALRAACIAVGVVPTVTGTSPITIGVTSCRLNPIVLTTSAGTVTSQATTTLIEPARMPSTYAFQYDGVQPWLEIDPIFNTNETFFLSAHRKAFEWVAPQIDWQTPAADTAFAASTTGLVGPSDLCPLEEEEVTPTAYHLAATYLAGRTGLDFWKNEARIAGLEAVYTKLFDTPNDRKPGRSSGYFGRGFEKQAGGGLGIS